MTIKICKQCNLEKIITDFRHQTRGDKVYVSGTCKKWDEKDSSTWTWQIDHIKPQSLFDYKSMEDDEFNQCWALENLRPYSSKQNWLDGINRTRHDNNGKKW